MDLARSPFRMGHAAELAFHLAHALAFAKRMNRSLTAGDRGKCGINADYAQLGVTSLI
jgi:hypothetical protein